MTLASLPPGAPEGLTHHSDRGVQYASRAYTELLESKGIRISMTESGDPRDNAVAERANGIIKNETLRGRRFQTVGETRIAVAAAVDF